MRLCSGELVAPQRQQDQILEAAAIQWHVLDHLGGQNGADGTVTY
jgi:hypothetical protein